MTGIIRRLRRLHRLENRMAAKKGRQHNCRPFLLTHVIYVICGLFFLFFFLAANASFILRLLNDFLRQLPGDRIVVRELHVE